MSNATQLALPWHRREDTWAVFIALGLVVAATAAFFAGASTWVGSTALSFPAWSGGLAKITTTLGANPAASVALFAVFLVAFSAASAVAIATDRVHLPGTLVVGAVAALASTASVPLAASVAGRA